ncbi:NF-X1-type zinc finger protein NFXL1 [Trichinella papuae]|uniref:NF-X1-type zinc finger protein NFXL1 n=1 Tax=Trichinella papuae TaxID=268474 RepID=A0A0V1N7E1_9BILA|nr:NF-X1-type zinc finger protein NFXL1 [Trichinella papuae]
MQNSEPGPRSRETSYAEFAPPMWLEYASFDSNAHEQDKVASDLKNEERLCVICIETFTKEQDIWSCKVCSCVLHFSCVEKWSTVSKDSYGRWRCPGCRNSYSHIPTKKCFCGKRTEMKNETDEDFFSCGLKCGKPLLPKKVSTYWICPHVCRRVCHPGPCGKCMSFAAAPCYCGQIVKMGNCSELDNDRSVCKYI